MKRSFISIAVIFLTVPIMCQYISEEKAVKVAKGFMKSQLPTIEILNITEEFYKGELVYYIINFKEGGWIIISSKESTIPVLAFNEYGAFQQSDKMPDPFIYILTNYKEQILNAETESKFNPKIKKKWDQAINSDYTSVKSSSTGVGVRLMNSTPRGDIAWNQSKNWDNTCTPRYNEFTQNELNLLNECKCDRKSPVGCGPVAMGQIMWYWQWPESSQYRTYNWALMPGKLKSTTGSSAANEVAHLLRDIGYSAVLNYSCLGTSSPAGMVVSSFHDEFSYLTPRKVKKNDWTYDDAWGDLIRSEINSGRPVIYFGDQCDLCLSKHAWVIDGISAHDPDYFLMNFGWGEYENRYFNYSNLPLTAITPTSQHDYTENQRAIVGISPTLPLNIENIYNVNYSHVYEDITEIASQNIILPANNDNIIIHNNGTLNLKSGKRIIIQAGFTVETGGMFTAIVDSQYETDYEIDVYQWKNFFSPNGDGNNDELKILLNNADSWEFIAKDPSGTIIYQSAGIIEGNSVILWNGENSTPDETYDCTIIFKNSFGQEVSNNYDIEVVS